jgi:hypothetical protein
MPILYGTPSRNPHSSLRLPSSRRISTPNSQRLATITEGPITPPPIPRRSSQRDGILHSQTNSRRNSGRWSGSIRSETTQRTAPPPYNWVPEPIVPAAETGDDVVVDEKLARLRAGESEDPNGRRGGWFRVVLIAGILLLIIGLAVGLGVGLTRKEGNRDDEGEQSSNTLQTPPQKFPLGQYSLVTALRNVDTSCTSNPATWRCFPYIEYATDGSTNDTSLAPFNWVIYNTSSPYATTKTMSPMSQMPANLSVSTSNDPFGITFNDKALTYNNDPTNETSAHYSFTFTMPRRVIPSPAITADGAAAECFYNDTVFSANLYLTAPRVFPAGDTSASGALGGYEQWPYAIDITQTAAGGDNVPICYRTIDGRRDERIEDGLIPQPVGAECLCEYRNY